MTSNDVVCKLRKKLGIKKIGHTGTLDPLAIGVLPIAVGSCTRLIEYLDHDKKYIAKIKFGETSTTYDEEGEKTFVKTPEFSELDLQNVIKNFRGKIKQKPPMYSAIKVGGKKLYEMARGGHEIEVPIRVVEIYEILIKEFSMPYVTLSVSCSKGTYIRSLAHDIGQELGCGAYLAELQRTKAGAFEIENSKKIEDEIEKIMPDTILPFDKYNLNDTEFERIKNGNPITVNVTQKDDYLFLIYNKKIVSFAKKSGNIIKVEKNFIGEMC